MSYVALVDAFSSTQTFPIRVENVIQWIGENTDHKVINLYPVGRNKKAFRGAFRRRAVSTLGSMYGSDYEIITDVLFGADLPEEWQRLVICKEVLHVFDQSAEQVNTPEAVRRLIPSVIAPELKNAPFLPAVNDHLGAFRAMAVLIPAEARVKLAAAHQEDRRSIVEIARLVKLPDYYVDIWLRVGDQLHDALCAGRD